MKLEKYMYSEINPLRFSWAEQMKRKTWHCQHRHSGLRHTNCYNVAHNIQERVGCFDIETGALDAGFDIVYTWFLKTSGKDEIVYDCISLDDLQKGRKDRRILESLVNTLWEYDRIITHYGSNFRFDIPFVRTRCIRQGIDFPTCGMLWVSDTYSMAKKLLCLKSNRQGRVASAILGKDIKTKMEDNHWLAVKYGTNAEKRKALKYIRDHCEADVHQLDENYLAMKPYMKNVRTSI